MPRNMDIYQYPEPCAVLAAFLAVFLQSFIFSFRNRRFILFDTPAYPGLKLHHDTAPPLFRRRRVQGLQDTFNHELAGQAGVVSRFHSSPVHLVLHFSHRRSRMMRLFLRISDITRPTVPHSGHCFFVLTTGLAGASSGISTSAILFFGLFISFLFSFS
jgi:hypothetical protein